MSGVISLIQPIAPLFVMTLAVAMALAAIAIRRSLGFTLLVSFAGLIGALLALPWMADSGIAAPMFADDALSVGFAGIILLTSLLILVVAASYWLGVAAEPTEEYPLLLVVATIGAVTVALGINFIPLFIGLETLTLAMIGMIAYPRWRPEALEAALKYLVLSGMSSALLLLGLGLVDLATGHLSFAAIQNASGAEMLLLPALALIVVGAGFKLSVVPFHIWVPDVYAGASAPSAAFLATVPKIAVIAVVSRLLFAGATAPPTLALAMTIAGVASMLVGNLLALLQQNLKRILGYSSIAQLGYVLVALLAAGALGRSALLFFVAMYSVTVIGAFGVLSALSVAESDRDMDRIDDIRGLFWRHPLIAGILTLALLSLAGIPPALGFMAKMYVMAAGVHSHLRILIATMVVSSVIGLFYYLRVIIAMTQTSDSAEALTERRLTLPVNAAIGLIGAAILGFGIMPQPLLSLLKAVFHN
jgi:NADH-quinone oxidoreductase subunit N